MGRHTSSTESFDVCVIGGGPAGLIAAGRAAELGARVVLFEGNRSPGRKLLITGGGRCNITNAEFRRHVLVEKYGSDGKYLHSLFARFDPHRTIQFFGERGLATRTEAENRVFPVTDSAASVLQVLLAYTRSGGVDLRTGAVVKSIIPRAQPLAGGSDIGAPVCAVQLRSGEQVEARRFVLATGGRSRPETGSTGDGFRWLRELGHTVREPAPSLVPIRVRESWITALQGLSIPDTRLTAEFSSRDAGRGPTSDSRPRRLSERGKLLFTHFGLSGPLALNMSGPIADLADGGDAGDERDFGEYRAAGDERDFGEYRAAGDAITPNELILKIDLFPSIDHSQLERGMQRSFDSAPNRKLRNSLPAAIPSRLAPVLLALSAADPEKPANSVTRIERRGIAAIAKALPLTFDGLLGEDRAVVTSGGVALGEVDFRTMQSRIRPNLYLVGDILDFERRSGGYSLQICWASGWVAGEHCAGVT